MKKPRQDDPSGFCGCCEGIEELTPQPIVNRPSLDTLAYRVGTHASFLETMKARLSRFYLEVEPADAQLESEATARHLLPRAETRAAVTRLYPLRGLTTRAAADPSIALLDAWATVADVLTFYQERIANEGYLGTARERRSLVELARLVGYTPRPGVAATVYLAYTLDDKAQEPVVIPAGARAQSVPGPGELPQSFETVEKLEARAEWNLLKPRLTRPQTAYSIQDTQNDFQNPHVYLQGISTNLKPNDPLLIDFGWGAPHFTRVKSVTPEPKADRTLVTLQWSPGMMHAAWSAAATPGPEALAVETRRQLDAIVERYLGQEADRINLSRGATFERVSQHLRRLQQQLAADVPFTATLSHLDDETLPGLEAERRNARARGYTDLAPWLENMLVELSNVATGASAVEVGVPAHESAAALMPDVAGHDAPLGIDGRADGDRFKDVLVGLVKPATLPPRNALTLERSAAVAFDTKADTHIQLVGAFRPEVRKSLRAATAGAKVAPDVPVKVYALRTTASLFGHNVQQRMRIPVEGGEITPIGEWPIVESVSSSSTPPVHTWIQHEEAGTIYLDASYEQIQPDSWVVIDTNAVELGGDVRVRPADPPIKVRKIAGLQTHTSRAEYGWVGPSTRVVLDSDWLVFTLPDAGDPSDSQMLRNAEYQIIRRTAVYAQSEELALAEEPIEEPICGSEDNSAVGAYVELDGIYADLQSGRWLIVTGERTDVQVPDPDGSGMIPVTGIQASELVMLAEAIQCLPETAVVEDMTHLGDYKPRIVPGEKYHTYVRFDHGLQYCYKRDTVQIYGNVAKATHGETRNEVLGNGDAAQAFQSFVLKQPPLTFVAAPTPAGAESTLHVWINDIEWHEADRLAGLGPADRNFITRTGDEGKTTVILGNGRQGARAPTGIENIKAVYRYGIGRPGNVRAEQVSLLVTRPLNVKEVINPMVASGGADKETGDQIRRRAPLAVLALDRLISIPDYADFALTFAGIGKASAVRLTDGRRQLVHVTIAGAGDIPIDTSSDLYRNLVKALRDYGDPYLPLQVDLRELMLLVLSANVRLLPDYQWEPVVTNIRARLLDTLGFERQELGQDVLLSQVMSTIQSVPGVSYVDVDLFGGIAEKDQAGVIRTPDEIARELQQIIITAQTKGPEKRVPVDVAHVDGRVIRPAQLAVLSPEVEATLILNEVKR